MLIEQIIEFRLGGPGSLAVHVLLQLHGYFHDKTKIFKANLQVDYCLLLKYYTRQCTLSNFSLPGPNHLPNLIPKCKILNEF